MKSIPNSATCEQKKKFNDHEFGSDNNMYKSS